MYKATISKRCDRSFPFSRTLFEDPHAVYHGTWSTYAQRIESGGFGGCSLPFDHNDITAISDAWKRVGVLESYAGQVFFTGKSDRPREELSMTGSFWHARAYATDRGGEVVRIMLKEARDFEALCSEDATRRALKARWEEGLRNCPGHAATLEAVEFLADKNALQLTRERVTKAREAIESVVRGGYPVVYAISVQPQWFGEKWDRYLAHWEEGNRAAVELRCPRGRVSLDRIVAKATFPNGTDPDFLGDLIGSWAEAESLSQSK